MLNDLASELLEGADGLLGLLGADKKDKEEAPAPKEEAAASTMRIYCFQSLDQISEAARAALQVYDGENTLYKKPEATVLPGHKEYIGEFTRLQPCL